MARYIDADELYRRVKTKTNPYGKPTLDYESGVKVLNMIEQQPTADVVEVVRCKDCLYRVIDIAQKSYCLLTDKYCDDTDYCSSGDRKEQT